MKNLKIYVLILFVLTLVFSVYLVTSKTDYLILRDTKTGEIFLIEPFSDKREFTVKWTHSVELTPWEEIFIVDKFNNIILDRTRFKSFGAGVPDYAGDTAILEDGYVVFSNINQVMDNLVYGISPFAKHTLILNDKVYPLYEIVPPDSGVSFKIVKLNKLEKNKKNL